MSGEPVRRRSWPAALGALATLVLALGHGCVGFEPGIDVALVLRATPRGAATALTVGDGSTLSPAVLGLTVDHVELVACGATGGHHHAALETLRAVLGPSIARAQHTHHSPLMLLGPVEVDLLDDPTSMPGTFGVAPGCYDRLRVDVSGLSLEAPGITARSAAGYTATASIDPPLEIDATALGSEPTLVVTFLSDVVPFALLPDAASATDGDVVLAGIAAEASASVLDR